MKNKLLDYLLLDKNLYKRPLRTKIMLLFLCVGIGTVYIMEYSVKSGFGFFNNVYAIITGAVLILFTGVFSVVVFCWPVTDFMVSITGGVEKFNLIVKRMKLVKGFALAVIYTGIISTLIKIPIYMFMEIRTAVLSSLAISMFVSIWAGAIIARCIFAVFEEAGNKRLLVFLTATAWYYIIVVQITGFIIKSAYSIIL